jgi:hypothetical protein
MKEEIARQRLVHHRDRTYDSEGIFHPYHDIMRSRWEFIIDHKLYHYLPDDISRAEDILKNVGYWISKGNAKGLREILKKIAEAPSYRKVSFFSISDLIDEIIGKQTNLEEFGIK